VPPDRRQRTSTAECNMIMPVTPRARPCADRCPATCLRACGSIVAAAGMCALRGCMGARAAQTLGLRLLRLVLCGAASSEHVSHAWMLGSGPHSDAVTCESIGGTLGSRGISAVHGTCAPLHPHPLEFSSHTTTSSAASQRTAGHVGTEIGESCVSAGGHARGTAAPVHLLLRARGKSLRALRRQTLVRHRRRAGAPSTFVVRFCPHRPR